MSNRSITPLRAYHDTRLEQEDITLLGILCGYTDADGYCFPSLDTLSKIFSPIVGRDAPYSHTVMSKKISKLRVAGYIVVRCRRTTDSGSYKTNMYQVIMDAQLPDEYDRRITPCSNSIMEKNMPCSNSPAIKNTSCSNLPSEKNTPCSNSPVEKNTNDPIERPSNERTGTAPPSIFSLYEQNIGLITPMMADRLRDAEKEFPMEWIRAAIEEAVIANTRKWGYIDSILKRWKVDGFRVRGGFTKRIGQAARKTSWVDTVEQGLALYREMKARKNGIRRDDHQGAAGVLGALLESAPGSETASRGGSGVG